MTNGRSGRDLVVTLAGVAAVMVLGMVGGRLIGPGLRGAAPPAPSPDLQEAGAAPVATSIALPRRAQRPPWDDLSGIAVGVGAVWAARCELLRVDPPSNQVLTTVAGTGRSARSCVRGVAAAAGMVWGAVPRVGLVRVDPVADRVDARVAIPGVGASLAVTATGVWALCCPGEPGQAPDQRAGGTLVRVDPRSARVVGRIRLDTQPTAVAAGPGGVWVAGVGRLSRVDPVTGRVLATARVAGDLRGGGKVAVAGDAVWVAASAGGLVLRADPLTGRILRRFAGAVGVRVVVVDGTGWALGAGGLLPLDRSTGPAAPLDGVDLLSVTDAAVGWGALWIMTWDRIVRVDTDRLR